MNDYAIELSTNAPVLATSNSDKFTEYTVSYDDGNEEIEDATISNSFYYAILYALGYDDLPEIEYITLKVGEEY